MALDIPALLDQLTLEEKAALTSGVDFWHTVPVERLGIPSIMLADGPHGLRKQAEKADHVGIGGSNPATCFVPAVGLGSTWNIELAREMGAALGREGRKESLGVILGPGINIKRSPLCGRNFEYFSEDPHVAGEMGAAVVEGIQSQGVGTSVKHFAANSQETDRLRVSSEVDERTLREIYLPAFERVMRAKPWTVMCSYNKINGVWASQNPWLLTELLRDEWGYEGLVVSDWGAVVDRVAGLPAGLDLEMPGHQERTPAQILEAVRGGAISEAELNTAVRRILELIDKAVPGVDEPLEVDYDAHHEVARRVALEASVLLSNDGVLPLAEGASVAVVGELARTPRYQGAGSSQVIPTQISDALTALTARIPGLTFAPGYDPALDDAASPDLVDEAVRVARDADVTVVFIGLPQRYESEGFDRTHMDLPANQTELLHAVTAAAKKTVVVLSNGSAVLVPWRDSVNALVEGWLGGQAGGEAMAALLTGEVSFSGKLTETLPLRLEDNPSYGSYPGELGTVRYGEGVFVGYRGYDDRHLDVAYPFGHGLTYSRFEYTDVRAEVLAESVTASTEEAVRVSVTVTNVGDVDAAEIVQVYVGDPKARVKRPVRELKAFAKVALAAGKSRELSFVLSGRDLAYWHPMLHQWAVEAGEFVIEVGASSRDIRGAQTIEVRDGDDVAPVLDRQSTYEEWVDDEVGRRLLTEAMDAAGKTMMDVEVIGNFPMARLAAFEDMLLTDPELDALVERYLAERG